MMHSSAMEVYSAMLRDILLHDFKRLVRDRHSPRQGAVHEARLGLTYSCIDIADNVVSGCDLRWATANVLHFFQASEDGSMLARYNPHAAKFLTEGRFVGAYGVAAMPGITTCIARLLQDSSSRRAVVSLGGLDDEENYNLPRCMSCFHFIAGMEGLELLVYQRSLHLSVMPYDYILLCNVLNYVATAVSIPPYCIRWTIGSLHSNTTVGREVGQPCSVLLPTTILANRSLCKKCLIDPSNLPEPFSSWMYGPEVRA